MPFRDPFSALFNIWLISHTGPVTPSCYLIPALVLASPFPKAALWQLWGWHFIPANIPPGLSALTHLKGFSLFCCVEVLKTKTREGTVPAWHKQGHVQRKVTFFFSFSVKVGVTVDSNRRYFRRKWDLLKSTNISACVLSYTLMSRPSCNLTVLLIFAVSAGQFSAG